MRGHVTSRTSLRAGQDDGPPTSSPWGCDDPPRPPSRRPPRARSLRPAFTSLANAYIGMFLGAPRPHPLKGPCDFFSVTWGHEGLKGEFHPS